MNFTKAKHILACSGFQAGILMLYNDLPETVLTFEEIKTALGMSVEELTPVMALMVKTRILEKTDDSYSLNMSKSACVLLTDRRSCYSLILIPSPYCRIQRQKGQD